jgi:hypothetical protein
VYIEELKQRLLEEGCNPHNFSIGPGGSDVYCLEQQDGMWRVFHTERGKADAPIPESMSEVEACEFYFSYITRKMRYDHLVGFFVSEQNAIGLESRSAQNGIQSHKDKSPFGGWSDPRYHVFVVGKNIFKARAVLGELPRKDDTVGATS